MNAGLATHIQKSGLSYAGPGKSKTVPWNELLSLGVKARLGRSGLDEWKVRGHGPYELKVLHNYTKFPHLPWMLGYNLL